MGCTSDRGTLRGAGARGQWQGAMHGIEHACELAAERGQRRQWEWRVVRAAPRKRKSRSDGSWCRHGEGVVGFAAHTRVCAQLGVYGPEKGGVMTVQE